MIVWEAPPLTVERCVQSEVSMFSRFHVGHCQNIGEFNEVKIQVWHRMAMVKMHREVLRTDLDDYVEATFYRQSIAHIID